MSLADVLRLRAEAGLAESHLDTSVIFVWLPGGPPHMEMYDMKPQAPVEYRGEFHPIETNVPGMEVCELMPRHTQCADRYTIIRSIAHNFADHGGGHKRFLTGRDPKEPTGFVNDYPAVGSVVAKCRADVDRGIPNYVSGTDAGRAGVDTYSFGAAYLGATYAPFNIPGDPSSPSFSVKNIELNQSFSDRLDDRLSLLRGFDRLRRNIDRSGMMEAMDSFQERATHMLCSDATRSAFNLAEEPDSLRDRYGRHAWGQRALLARRLVEAGVRFVNVYFAPSIGGQSTTDGGWDTHGFNNTRMFPILQKRHLPITDQTLPTFLEDLDDRGLLDETLVVWMGEFGRTPKINDNVSRDHWPQCYTALLAGAGLKRGYVHGASDKNGAYPARDLVRPDDLAATMFHLLGIDPATEVHDPLNRPVLIAGGKPVRGVMA